MFSYIFFNARVPLKFSKIEFDDLTAVSPSVIEGAKKYIEGFPRDSDPHGVYFHSTGPGTAKTALSVCIMKELIRLRKIRISCLFVRAFDLLYATLPFSSSDDQGAFLWDKMTQSEFVILDDLGKDFGNRPSAMQLFRCVDTLYGRNIPLVVTANFSLDDIVDSFAKVVSPTVGMALASRLTEMCSIVSMEGSDFRLR